MRRIRTRLPTYLSTGLGALVDISSTPRNMPQCTRQQEIMRRAAKPPYPVSNAILRNELI
jgi:hypothetical protein